VCVCVCVCVCEIFFSVGYLAKLDLLLLISYVRIRGWRLFCVSLRLPLTDALCIHPSPVLPLQTHKIQTPTSIILLPQQRPQNCLFKATNGRRFKQDFNMTPSKQNPSVSYLYISLKHSVSFLHWLKLRTMQKVEAS